MGWIRDLLIIGGQSKIGYETDRFYQGSIEEVLVYDRALTKAELSQSEQYLAQKWGVSLLQRNHLMQLKD